MATFKQIISTIKQGDLVCLPTDTLYSLSCDATNDDSVKRIFQVKGRDFNKPLPIFVYNLEQAQQYGFFNDKALMLAKNFWPGQLTMVMPRKVNSNLSPYVYGSNPNIAIRVPQHQLLLEILRKIQLPLVATSANKSDTLNKLTLDEVKSEFKDQINIYIENNEPIQVNQASTIIDCCTENLVISRQGQISMSDLMSILDK